MARADKIAFPNALTGDNLPIVDPRFAVLSGDTTLATPSTDMIYLLTKSSASTITITNPTAGGAATGGDDGTELTFIDAGGHAHVIQGDATMTATDTSGFHGADLDKGTFGGTVGDQFTIVAYNGLWYDEQGKSIHITLADT